MLVGSSASSHVPGGAAALAAALGGSQSYVALGVSFLAVAVGALFWRLQGGSSSRSDAQSESWEHRRHRAVARIAELLAAKGRRPARKVFLAMVDDLEDVLVTQKPVAVPRQSARLDEMSELLRQSLGAELQDAMRRGDVGEVEELRALGQRAQRHVDKTLCSSELDQAAAFLREQGTKGRRQIFRLLGFCDRETKFWLGLGLFIKVVSQIPGPLRMLHVSATVTAAARGSEGLEEFHQAAIMSFWLFAAEKLLQFAGRVTMFRGEQLFTVRLKREVYAACLRQDMAFFDAHRCGELQLRLNGDTKEVCQKVLYFPVRFVQFSFFLAFNLLTLLSANPRLVAATLSVLPVSLFGNLFLMRRLQKFYSRMQQRAEASAGMTQEVLSNIRTVRACAREPRELQRYERDQEYEARILGQVNLLQGMTQPFLHAISELSFFVGLYYGGVLISQGLLMPGEVITLVQGTQACTGVLTDLFDTLPEIAKAGRPASRICNLLEQRSSIETDPFVEHTPVAASAPDSFAPGSTPAANGGDSNGGVEFDDVRFAYPARREIQVLRGLSFTAKGGEVLALVGETGCGKSTVVNLLLRFYAPLSGRITFEGRPIEDYNVHWLRRQIGVVAQEPLLFGTSIRENLLYGASTPEPDTEPHDDEWLHRVCVLANAWEFIRQLPEGLSTEVGERGVQLSGGQKQRLAIARAIVKRPKVLLLDEATSALDVESEQVVQGALDEVIRASSCTTIVIAHRLATIRNASKIVVISEGVVQEEGSPRALAELPGGLYARMLRLQDSFSHSPVSNGKEECCNGHAPPVRPEVPEEGLRLRSART